MFIFGGMTIIHNSWKIMEDPENYLEVIAIKEPLWYMQPV
mgnify:FL=1|jgi:hypothetical protein